MSSEKNETKNVLMVEDDVNLLKLNTEILTRKGYVVFSAKNLKEARRIIDSNSIDVAVLDVVLPDGDGLSFAGEVKTKSDCPVIILSSKSEHEDIVKGMNSDADMYMTKPFLIPELIARIDGLLKKHRMGALRTSERVNAMGGELTFDTVTRRVTLHGENLDLSPNDFTLLLVLTRNENKTVPQDFLYETVWGQTLGSDTTALRSGIARLRKKLQSSEYTINAVRGEGYKFEKI